MLRVLIAEDEPPIARSIKHMIEKLDDMFEVSGMAQDGEAALQLLDDGAFDVVITDIRMPMMNGLQLMEHISTRYPDVLLVVISGYGTFEYSAQALRAHALDYLLKPVSEHDMKQLLTRLKHEHTRRSRAKLQQLMTAGLNRAPEMLQSDTGQEVLVALLTAEDAELFENVNLEAQITDLLGELGGFTWVFMGDALNERVVLLEDRPGMVELMEYVHEYLLDNHDPVVRCAIMTAGVQLCDTRASLKKLRDISRRMKGGELMLIPSVPDAPCLTESARQLIERVTEYLNENYKDHITSQMLSEKFGYVPSYIALLFKKAHMPSPTEYLNEVRLERAKELMKHEPQMMVKEIAESVGFKNQYHFSKAFKKYTGQWPTDFKMGD